MIRSRVDYCAYCGRLDRLDVCGICALCSELPQVVEIQLEPMVSGNRRSGSDSPAGFGVAAETRDQVDRNRR